MRRSPGGSGGAGLPDHEADDDEEETDDEE